MDSSSGFLVLIIYGLVAFGLTFWYSRGYGEDKTSFLLARRELNTVQGSFSIAAAWLWAPGLFISAQQAYVNGLAGLFWFCLGNFLTLGAFAYFAKQLREKEPDGFTFSGYLKHKYSGRVQSLFVVEMILLAICAFAINLLAGSRTVDALTGMDEGLVRLMMVAVAILYSFRSGLKATVVTEMLKIVIVWTGVLVLVPWVIVNAGGWDVVIAGMTGIKNPSWVSVFLGFGAAAFLGHMGGPWGDNSFYQRAFSIKKESIIPSFVIASFVFIVIPIMMGLLGFVAAGSGMQIDNVGVTNAMVIAEFLPDGASLFFMFMVFAGLVAILDSQFSSVANMTGHDIYNQFKGGIKPLVKDITRRQPDNRANYWARGGMISLAVVGLLVSHIPGIQILHLFLFFAVLRASVWIPSMISFLKPDLISEKGMFWGILVGATVGEILFVSGKLGYTDTAFLGTMIAVFGTPLLAIGISKNPDWIGYEK